MATPWDQAKEKKYVKQERREAAKPGSRAQLNSGRLWFSLGDVTQGFSEWFSRILKDAKTTDSASYTITKKDWLKLKQQAQLTPPGCTPMLQIDIQEISLTVLPTSLWDEVVKYIMLIEEK